MITEIINDVRYALRMLTKNPAFAGVVVLTLALGIGANAAIFSLLDKVLLQSLPVANPDQLGSSVSVRPEGWTRHRQRLLLSHVPGSARSKFGLLGRDRAWRRADECHLWRSN